MYNKFILLTIATILLLSCEKVNKNLISEFKESPEKTINVKNRITEITTDLLIGFGEFSIIDTLLVYNDFASTTDKGIHFLNKNTFEHVTSTGYLGRGPGEIISLGANAVSPDQSVLWVDDHGNQVRWKFPLDSILKNEDFLPQDKVPMNPNFFLKEYEFLNDTTVLGIAIIPLSANSMEMAMAKSDFRTTQTEKFGFKHPDIKDRYETYATSKLSIKHNIYINCFERIDLMTICDLDGNLIKAISSEQKNNETHDFLIHFFKNADVYKDLILVSYMGKEAVIQEEGKAPEFFSPTKLLVFDVDGTFIKTIEVGYQFSSFCVDEDNERVVLFFEDRENPLGFFSLKDIGL